MNRQTWEIGVIGGNKSLYRSTKARQKGDRLDEAPKDNATWTSVEGKGVHPPPQVKRS